MASNIPRTCNCPKSFIELDDSMGLLVCTNCGAILDEQCFFPIKDHEKAYGGAFLLASSNYQSGTLIRSNRGGFSLKPESKEITMNKARHKITTVGNLLNLNIHCIDMAVNFYSMALARDKTKGRKSAHVVAACIYITCRMEGTAHMLIDIADAMDIDVYTLGHTFLNIANALSLNLPLVDPCLYVMRFAHGMSFGDKTHEVFRTSLRLVQRMKRDWIHTGRRPSGLCGAALLIAARIHGFNRTVLDVIKEVKVHENTVRKRMQEFGETSSSSLTIEEFMQVDLEEEHDPPSFLKSRMNDRSDIIEKATEEMVQLEQEINRQIAISLSKKRGPWAKYSKEALATPGSPAAGPKSTSPSTEPEYLDAIADMTMTAVTDCLTEAECPTQAAGVDTNSLPTASTSTQRTDESILMPPPGATYLQLHNYLRPSLASLGIFPGSGEILNAGQLDSVSGELDLDGIDESEMNSYIKSEEEAKLTTVMWMADNGEFMIELEVKQKRKAEEEEEKKKRGEKRQRKATSRQQPQSYSSATAGEAIVKMLAGKRLSKVINYEKLKGFDFSFNSSPSVSEPTVSTSDSEPSSFPSRAPSPSTYRV